MDKKKILLLLTGLLLWGCQSGDNFFADNKAENKTIFYDDKVFETKALAEGYLKKKIETFLTPPVNSEKLVKEIYYAKYKHPDLLKNIVAAKPEMFTDIEADPLVDQKKSETPFLDYINYIRPFLDVPVLADAAGTTDSSFTASWNSIGNGASYTLVVNGNLYDAGNATSYEVTGLKAETTYSFHVKAVSNGLTSVSTEKSVTTIPIVNNGLVAYYPFNGNSNDMSGNGNNPTVRTVTLTTDRFGVDGKAYYFNGGYISIPDSASLSPASQITVNAWVKGDTTSGYSPIVSKGYASEYALRIASGSYGFGDLFTITRKFTPLNVPIPANTWVMMTMTYDGSNIYFYKNAVNSAYVAQSGAINDNNSAIQIGRNNYPEYFQGTIDDVRIYNRALTSSEIQQLYQAVN